MGWAGVEPLARIGWARGAGQGTPLARLNTLSACLRASSMKWLKSVGLGPNSIWST